MNQGYVSFENDSSIVDGVATVFPLFFFMITALVCSTTMQEWYPTENSNWNHEKRLDIQNLLSL